MPNFQQVLADAIFGGNLVGSGSLYSIKMKCNKGPSRGQFELAKM